MERTIKSIIQILKDKSVIRHLSQEGCHISFFLHGVHCSLIVKNSHFYLGVDLIREMLAEIDCEKLSELTLILSGEKGVPGFNIFISENDELCIFMEKKDDGIFNSSQWFYEYEKLLVVRSYLNKLLIKGSNSEKKKSMAVSQKWMAI